MKALKRTVSLAEFTNAFVPFGLLLVLALWAAELTTNLTLYREIYTIWISTVLLAPALCFFALPEATKKQENYWLLFWTFSYVAYLVHFYYGVFVTFNGSLADLYAGQGAFFATFNLLLTLWWGLDVVLAWFSAIDRPWVRIQRVGVHLYVGAVYVVATTFLFHGFVQVLGVLLALSISAALVYRLVHGRRHRLVPH